MRNGLSGPRQLPLDRSAYRDHEGYHPRFEALRHGAERLRRGADQALAVGLSDMPHVWKSRRRWPSTRPVWSPESLSRSPGAAERGLRVTCQVVRCVRRSSAV
jgi:hypothetical protein